MHAEPDSSDRQLFFTRVFDAPCALVFQAWTDLVQVAEWWGPPGFTNIMHEWDVRPGGAIRLDMHDEDESIYPMSGVFREVAEPRHLVFTATPLDERGRPLFETLNAVTFADEGDRTLLTLRVDVIHETESGVEPLAGMREGWSQTLSRLETHLGKGQ